MRREIAPTAEMLDRVAGVRGRLLDLAARKAHEHHLPLVRAVVAGSAARGTFLSDRVDIDLFLLFPPELPRADLESHGLQLAGLLFETAETRYAEHPYLRGTYEGFQVDAVPGYAIRDPSHPQTAVDRTPFHHEYLRTHQTPELIEETRLAKQFLRAQGIYGSEAKTQGLSGYAVELLILKYGSLDELLAAARTFTPPVRIVFTPGSSPRVPAEVPLLLDDPVDPHRNVTSALSRRNFTLLLLAAQAYLAAPDPRFFRPRPAARLGRAGALERIRARRTHVVALTLPRPRLVDDIVYPQLAKGARAIAEEARRAGFTVVGSAFAASEATVTILLEADPAALSEVRSQDGPPPGPDRVAQFLAKWTDPSAPVLQGPFVAEDGRLAVETRRGEPGLEAALNRHMDRISLGRDLTRSLRAEDRFVPLDRAHEVPELELALGELLVKRLPWLVPDGAASS